MTDRIRYSCAGTSGSTGRRGVTLAVSMATLLAVMPATAREMAAAPSTSSLLEEMVATGVITQEQSDKILKGARARDAAKGVTASAPASESSRAADGTVRVQYVPQVVKDQIKNEVKQEVMAKAQAEGWAAPGETPGWAKRISFSGDVRGRYEASMFPKSNVLGTYDQVNWASLNSRSTPIDVANLSNITGAGATGSNALPFRNWDKDRTRERIRARVGIDAALGDGFTSGVRLATGDSSSPVSTNQTLGGSGGNFSKYQVWLDRAFIKYRPDMPEKMGLTATVGRFANPFFSTDLVWDDDVSFDGMAVSGTYQALDEVTPFLTVGAFPVFNTDFNISSYSEKKETSQNKWLYGAQAGTDWEVEKDTKVKVAAAYYHFSNIEGKSSDCYYLDQSCGSDLFRPTFAQQGNTYMGLRNNLNRTAVNDPNYQYFGFASGFHEVALTGRVDYDGLKSVVPGQGLRVSFDGDVVKNLSFSKNKVAEKSRISGADGSLNNTENDTFEGGDLGYLARVSIGTPKLEKRWDWNASLAYKYVESDAVVDAFADSDFGMGGTNLKGFILGGNLALNKNVWTSLRWMSADSIAGAPYSSDTVLFDISAKY